MIYIRGRKHWDAQPPRGTVVTQNPKDIHTIVLHHTAGYAPKTRSGAAAEMRHIQRYHFGNGWADIGYNIVIDPIGGIWEGRGVLARGAHTQGHNTGTIGIAFMGNYESRHINWRQRTAYLAVLAKLRLRGVKTNKIRGHREMPDQATACPGKNIMRRLRGQ